MTRILLLISLAVAVSGCVEKPKCIIKTEPIKERNPKLFACIGENCGSVITTLITDHGMKCQTVFLDSIEYAGYKAAHRTYFVNDSTLVVIK